MRPTGQTPCFRKEKGAHGIEERGIYRIHQFEKQEMIVICRPEESMDWFNKMWSYSVELFRSMDIPVRTLECCTGDLADLKVKSYDVEAWSPKQQKYFEVCSCSNLGDAQARRLGIRVKGADGKKYLAHTLNNTVVAPPRMLIAFLENNLRFDGEHYSVLIPEALRPYMGGKTVLTSDKKINGSIYIKSSGCFGASPDKRRALIFHSISVIIYIARKKNICYNCNANT